MPYEIKIELTDLQAKAWHCFIGDAQEWVETLVFHEVERSMNLIYEREAARMLADPEITTMPASRDEVVASADLTSARERDRQMLAALPTVE